MKTTVAKLAVFTAVMFLLSFGSALANDEGLPADRVIAAIQTAAAANPGLVKEVEVERKDGRLVVEIKMIGADGKKTELYVDPEKNEVIR